MQVVINGDVFDGGVNLNGVIASDGSILFPDSLAQTFAYDGGGRLVSATIVANGATYKQSYTYADAKTKNIATVSAWVKQ